MTVITMILSILSLSVAGAGGSNSECVGQYKLNHIRVSKGSMVQTGRERQRPDISVVPVVINQPDFLRIPGGNTITALNNDWAKGVRKRMAAVAVNAQRVKTQIPVTAAVPDIDKNHAVLYEKVINNSRPVPELSLNGVGHYTAEGLNVTGKNNTVRLNKFYAVAERKVQYRILFSADAKAVFRSSEGDFNACIDVQNKRISIATNPVTERKVGFLQANKEYLVEVYHIYQLARLRIVDLQSGESAAVEAIHDGQGGAGQGVLQPGFSVGMQWDHYCFGLAGGTSLQVRKITVLALKKKVKLLMYGDSITQPEGYFPTGDFPLAWTQRVIDRLEGNAMSSGRGGAQIDMVAGYIRNELPYIEAEYVMVTIGTNGGNTEENLTDLVNYIKSMGAIPILNNIPSNESGTQVAAGLMIEKVRAALGVKGCKFDLATSIAGDGKEVDKSTMYWEDYSGSYGWQIYHHPNDKGGQKMFDRTLADVPEIYQ